MPDKETAFPNEPVQNRYKLVSAKSTGAMEILVNDLINAGWDILDGISITPEGLLLQVMVNPKEKITRTGMG